MTEEQEVKWGLPNIGIPAEILFNPELTPTEKMLFGFIRNLSKSKRGCWASNKFLGCLIGCGKQTASNAVNNLKKYKYIIIKTIEDKRTKETERRIYENLQYPELYQGMVELFQEPKSLLDKNVKEQARGYIRKIIGVYKKNYTKVDTKADSISLKDKSYKESKPSVTRPSRKPSTVPVPVVKPLAPRRKKKLSGEQISQKRFETEITNKLINIYANITMNGKRYKASKTDRYKFRDAALKINRLMENKHNKENHKYPFEELGRMMVESMKAYSDESRGKMRFTPGSLSSNWWQQNVFAQYLENQFTDFAWVD